MSSAPARRHSVLVDDDDDDGDDDAICCWTDFVATAPNCSFPFSYNGRLFYGCITDMTGVSTADQPFACISVNDTPVVCHSPGRS